MNALIAWRHATAHGHTVFHAWVKAEGFATMGTCARAALGFLRVSMQVFKLTLTEAHAALADIKKRAGGFVPASPSPRLAPWATTAAKTSDAYLVQLATSAGLTLATFDAAIPGDFFKRVFKRGQPLTFVVSSAKNAPASPRSPRFTSLT